jgi:hypothetical protein
MDFAGFSFSFLNPLLGDAEARIIFPTSCCANAESATTDRIAQARLAQIHSERPGINRFSVIEAHAVSEFIQAREAVLHIVSRPGNAFDNARKLLGRQGGKCGQTEICKVPIFIRVMQNGPATMDQIEILTQ